MPKYSIYTKELLKKEKEFAVELYKKGFTMRAIAQKIGRSHTFIFNAVQEDIHRTMIDNRI